MHRFAAQPRDRPERGRAVVTVGLVDAVPKRCGPAFFVDIPGPGHIAENAVQPEGGGTVAAVIVAFDRVDMVDEFKLMAIALLAYSSSDLLRPLGLVLEGTSSAVLCGSSSSRPFSFS